MKNLTKLLFIGLLSILAFSCNENECTQDCALQEVLSYTPTASFAKGDCDEKGKTQVCHYDETTKEWTTICISSSALDAHLAHGDTQGSCNSLAIEDYKLGPRKGWKIPCDYTDETIELEGKTWYITYNK